MVDVNFEWHKKSWLLPGITKNTEKKWDRNLPSIGITHFKKEETKQNHNAIQYEEPTPTLQNTAYKMIVNNVNEWFEVMNIRYYEHL